MKNNYNFYKKIVRITDLTSVLCIIAVIKPSENIPTFTVNTIKMFNYRIKQ